MSLINQEKSVSGVLDYLNSSSESPVSQTSYHELSESPVRELDALAQLHQNIELLADLNSRFSFLMREIRYMMKA